MSSAVTANDGSIHPIGWGLDQDAVHLVELPSGGEFVEVRQVPNLSRQPLGSRTTC